MKLNKQTRLYAGITLLILATISPLFGFLIANTGLSVVMKTTIIGLLTAGIPEVLILGAAAILGKENFERIKSKVFALIRRLRPTARVGKTRYSIGLVMFLIPLIPTYIMAYAPQWLPDSSPERLYVNLAADFIFVSSLFILGGDFWDKLTALFVYDSRVTFQNNSHSVSSQQ
jgi:predicted lysophospholipase L1 biosynthesis ABC-type transport system permease subunit